MTNNSSTSTNNSSTISFSSLLPPWLWVPQLNSTISTSSASSESMKSSPSLLNPEANPPRTDLTPLASSPQMESSVPNLALLDSTGALPNKEAGPSSTPMVPPENSVSSLTIKEHASRAPCCPSVQKFPNTLWNRSYLLKKKGKTESSTTDSGIQQHTELPTTKQQTCLSNHQMTIVT